MQEMQETQVRSLGWEDPLEEDFPDTCLGNPKDRETWRATMHGGVKSLLMTEHTCMHPHVGSQFPAAAAAKSLSHVRLCATP